MVVTCFILRTLLFVGSLAALAEADYAPLNYDINLDAPPRMRWYQNTLDLIARRGFVWGPTLDILQNETDGAFSLADPVLEQVIDSFGPEYKGEIQGIADAIAESGVDTLGHVVTPGVIGFLNLFYEVTAGCTSIVGQDTDGHIFHGRNLDYALPGLTAEAADVHFLKGGLEVYRGTTYVGYVGLVTGMRPGGWSVTVNERFGAKYRLSALVKSIISGAEKGSAIGFAVRSALENEQGFSGGVERLSTIRLMAPSYLTFGGVRRGEGVILTRNREGIDVSNGTAAGSWRIDPDDGVWYRLQTNDDHWTPSHCTSAEPAASNCRRDAGNANMALVGRSRLDPQGLMTVLSQFPTLNSQTTYTTIMSARTGYYNSTVRT